MMKPWLSVPLFALFLLGGILDGGPQCRASTPATPVLEASSNGNWHPVEQVVGWGDNYVGQTNVPANLGRVTAVAGGYFHSLALRADGTVAAWGNNTLGETNVPAGLSGVIAVAGGEHLSMALKVDGTVVAWGLGSQNSRAVPAHLSDVTAISAGMEHCLALKKDGSVVAWGGNQYGQATPPAGLNNVVAISAGEGFSVALKGDGSVVAWGRNDDGQTRVPAGLNGVVAIAAGLFHTIALKNDGHVVAWGSPIYEATAVPANLSEVTAIAAVGIHSFALGNDGKVTAWGVNEFGYNSVPGPADAPADLVDVTAIAGGLNFGLAITSIIEMENVVAGGSGRMSATLRLTNPSTVNSLTGLRLVLPTSATGQFCLDTPLPAQLAPGQSVILTVRNSTDTLADALGKMQIFADGSAVPLVQTTLRARQSKASIVDWSGSPVTAGDGSRIVAWGANDRSQINVPAGLSDVVAISAGYFHTAALRSDGTVVAWGDNYSSQINVPYGLADVAAVAAGGMHTLALTSTGTVVAWGENHSGETKVPANLKGVVAIASGFFHSVALKSDGKVVAWGSQTAVPVGLSGVVAIAAGASHTVALKSDGKVVAWGSNLYGETQVPADLSGVVAIAAGAYHTVALKRDGTVVAWGDDEHDQTNVPTGLGDVIQITAGYYHTAALRSDGTVVAFGYNFSGQTKVPAGLSNVAAISAGAFHTVVLTEPANSFPSLQIGQHRDHTIFVKSTGAFPLEQIRAIIEGPDASQFSVLTTLPDVIDVGDQSPFTIRFAPNRVGQFNATLKVYSNAPDSPLVLPLKAFGNFELAATKIGVSGSTFTYAPLRSDSQTGLVLQKISFTNTTGIMLSGLRLTLSKLAAGVTVYSSSLGKAPGTAEVLYTNAIQPGETIGFDLAYADPQRRTASLINPVIKAEALEDAVPPPGPVAGSVLPVRQVRDTPQGPLLFWTSKAGTINVVEYSNDAGKTWFSAVHLLPGAANMFWVDRGQPETVSKPANKNARMYRVKRL